MNTLVINDNATTMNYDDVPAGALIALPGGKAPRMVTDNLSLAFPRSGKTQRVDKTTGETVDAGGWGRYVTDGAVLVIGTVKPAAERKPAADKPARVKPADAAKCGAPMTVAGKAGHCRKPAAECTKHADHKPACDSRDDAHDSRIAAKHAPTSDSAKVAEMLRMIAGRMAADAADLGKLAEILATR